MAALIENLRAPVELTRRQRATDGSSGRPWPTEFALALVDVPEELARMNERLRQFAARVKVVRLERGLRVADVARALSCDPSSIYGIERGRHAIRFRHLVALARLLEVDELDLFTLPDASPRHDLIDLTRRAPLRVVLSTREHLLAHLNDWTHRTR
jgi:transcriptional regulator with XRE-family HTH domain